MFKNPFLFFLGVLLYCTPVSAGVLGDSKKMDFFKWYVLPNRLVVLVYDKGDRNIEIAYQQQEIMDKPDRSPLKFQDDLFIYVVADKKLYRMYKNPILWRITDKEIKEDVEWREVIEKTWPLDN